jgi:glutamyl-tRNA synthetase
MVLGADRTRLSKRHGATSVTAYRDMGMLPDAFINFMARLGWSLGDQEFFTRQELIEHFSLERVGKSAGIFDPVKLQALNADHIQSATAQQIGPQVLPFLQAKDWDASNEDYLHRIIPTLQPRSKNLQEMADQAHFFYTRQISFDEKAAKKFLKGNVLEPLKALKTRLAELEDYSEKNLEDLFASLLEAFEIKLGKIAQPVRVALTGTSVSPGIFEVIAVLGKERVIPRLEKAIEFIEARVAAAK